MEGWASGMEAEERKKRTMKREKVKGRGRQKNRKWRRSRGWIKQGQN